MRSYTQLTREQRYQTRALLKVGHDHTELAGLLHVHKSMVGLDTNRNRGRSGYPPRQADQKACTRRKKPRRIVRIQWDEVDALLRQDWSPEQFSGWFKTREHNSVSHAWIFQHFWPTNTAEAICTATCVAKSSVANVMVAMKGVERFPTG